MKKGTLSDRLTLLHRIYDLYDAFIGRQVVACRQGCACCCTRNVTMTTLEGYAICRSVPRADFQKTAALLESTAPEKRFRPSVTVNRMAAMCVAGEDLPEERADPAWGPCPLLAEAALCLWYRHRPFGCRSMVSRKRCETGGTAEMDPLVLTVSTVIQQTIEHLDVMGCTGNFTDVLLALASDDRREQYESGRLLCQNLGLLPNRPLKVLMVPPEHREAVGPILDALNRIGNGR